MSSPTPRLFHLTGHVPASAASVLVPPHVVSDFRARMMPVGSRGCIVLRPLYRNCSWKPARLGRYPEMTWRDTNGVRYAIRGNRLALMLEIGTIPDGMLALHRCDTPACVAGAHIDFGSDAMNKADRARSERLRRLGLPFTLHPMRRQMVCEVAQAA